MSVVSSSIPAGTAIYDTDYIREHLFYGLTFVTSILAYAFYTLIFVAQCCIVIALRYLGPILISLAIIPETDFTSGYISTTFQVFSWSVMAAILIKVIGTTAIIGSTVNLNTQDFVAISAMNICYALAFLMIPVMTGLIFTGKGLGGAGAALALLGGGAMQGIAGSIGGFVKRNTVDRAKNSAVAGLSNGASFAGRKLKSAAGAVTRPMRDAYSSASKSVAPRISYAIDNLKRATPAGRAQYNHKHHGNAGFGNMPTSSKWGSNDNGR